MLSTKKFQEDFVFAITQEVDIESVLEAIVPVGTLSNKDVLQVYRSDYFARLTSAIGENFEALWAVIGDEDFFKLCREYLKKFPSETADLSDAGINLPIFLHEGGYEKDYPFIVDLANFEIAFWKTFHSPLLKEKAPVIASLEELIEAKIEFREDLKIFSWDYKIKNIWSYREVGFDNVSENFYDSQRVLMFRGESNVMLLELTQAQVHLLRGLKEGNPLSDVLETCEIEAEEVTQLFSELYKHSLIKSISSANKNS